MVYASSPTKPEPVRIGVYVQSVYGQTMSSQFTVQLTETHKG